MFEEILNATRTIKNLHPQLRYQQIMSIAASKGGWDNKDLFYCPDEVLLKGLNKLIEEENKI